MKMVMDTLLVKEIATIQTSNIPRAAKKDSPTECMTDNDGDGYGDEVPFGGVTPGTDCDDSNPNMGPFDFDGDGYTGCSGDCDDLNALTYPVLPNEILRQPV